MSPRVNVRLIVDIGAVDIRAVANFSVFKTMSDTVTAKTRTETGTLRMRRLRKSGFVPAVLYGHGESSVPLQLASREVDAAIRQGSQIVELKGDMNESALIKHVQWGPLGSVVLHLDLLRIDATEQIEVSVPIELRGESPGTRDGGIVNQLAHEAQIRCPANRLPEKFELTINELALNQSLAFSDLELPAGIELLDSPDEVIVQCSEPVATPEEDEAEGAEAAAEEPEIIGKSTGDDDGGDDES